MTNHNTCNRKKPEEVVEKPSRAWQKDIENSPAGLSLRLSQIENISDIQLFTLIDAPGDDTLIVGEKCMDKKRQRFRFDYNGNRV